MCGIPTIPSLIYLFFLVFFHYIEIHRYLQLYDVIHFKREILFLIFIRRFHINKDNVILIRLQTKHLLSP